MTRDVEQFLSERGDGGEIEEWFQEMKWETDKSYKFGDSGTDEFDIWLTKSLRWSRYVRSKAGTK